MSKYTYEMTFDEREEKTADAKMDALTVLGAKLSANELQKLKQVVLHEPLKLAMAKKAMGV